MRVLWVAKGLGPGGMEGLLVSHARLGDRESFDYRAAYLVERPNSVIPQLRDLGVPCTSLGNGTGRSPSWARDLRRLVIDEEIDVVHIHSPSVAAVARPVLRSLRHRPKLVYTEHNSWYSYGTATRLLNAATFPLDDAQISVSHAAVESMPSWFRRGIVQLTHGVDLQAVRAWAPTRSATRQELDLDEDDILVLTVANLRSEKAYDVLLDAARLVLDQHPEVRFLSVGQGPLLEELEQQHRRLDLGRGFVFLGFRDDVPTLLAASDIFALSSRSEGLPLGLMEAFAAGVAPVVTRVGGMPDHVHHESTGMLVQPESPPDLADAIGRLVDDEQLRRAISDNVVAASTAFDASHAVRQLEQTYREVMS